MNIYLTLYLIFAVPVLLGCLHGAIKKNEEKDWFAIILCGVLGLIPIFNIVPFSFMVVYYCEKSLED